MLLEMGHLSADLTETRETLWCGGGEIRTSDELRSTGAQHLLLQHITATPHDVLISCNTLFYV